MGPNQTVAPTQGHLYTGASFPFIRRWTKRLTICEERRWRQTTRKRKDWAEEPRDHRETQTGPSEISRKATATWRRSEAERLAKIYRALRKGREDERNTPGAADYYYGEMEMRRNAAPLSAERFVLWLYWLVSGYGLRAGRALISLAVTVLLFALFFDWWGFRPDQSFGRGLLFSIQSTSSLFRVPELKDTVPTDGGEALQVVLRLLGPLLFGLALLSLRGRVKR